MSTLSPHRVRERAAGARAVLLGAFVLLAGSFFKAQIIDREGYRLQSATNRLREVRLAAPRGTIFDRYGNIIAENEPGYSIKLFAPSEDSLRAVLARIRKLIPFDSSAEEQVLRRYAGARYQPALLTGTASFEDVSRLEEHRYLLPGLVVQTEPRRVYRTRGAVAHLVGYVGEVSEGDLAEERFPGARLGTIAGRDGLEQEYDSLLRGVEGSRYIEVDARGRMVREDAATFFVAPIPGSPIRTTIDLPLQVFIDSLWQAALPGTRGAMIAMTPDGEILALYSAPTFDPNAFVGGIPGRTWAELTRDPAKPLFNRATRGKYPPASPFKLATAAIALKRGIVAFGTRMPEPCRGGLQYGNRFFRCWKREGHGSLDLTGAIALSCDVYFYQLGLRIGLSNLLEEGTRLGFGKRTGVDLGSEVEPTYPPSTAYYDRFYGPRRWSSAVTLNLAIGQGENDQSLVGMTQFYAALAGNGTAEPPHVVRPPAGARSRGLGLTTAQLEGLRTSMMDVVRRGTAAASGGRELNVAGKTGTAQNPHGKDHGWFIAFAPADNPKIVIGSIMEFALHGSSVAPHVVRVIRRYLSRFDPTLARARVNVAVQQDSAPRVVEVPVDTTGAGR